MFMPVAVCSAALSGALVLAMVGSAVGGDGPGRPASSAPAVLVFPLDLPLAVPTTPAAPADVPPAVTGAPRAAATAVQLGNGY